MACEKCDGNRAGGCKFCPDCGDALRSGLTLHLVLGLVLFLICTYILIYEVFAMMVFFPETFGALAGVRTAIFIVVPMVVPVFSIEGVALQAYFVLLVAASLISAVALLRDVPEKILILVRQHYSKPIEGSAAFRVFTMFAALSFFQATVIALALMLGLDLESIDVDIWSVWEQVFILVQASVWEEVLCRVLMIGAPLAAIMCLSGKRTEDGEEPWRLLVGGFGIDRTVFVLIVFSSFMFGAAHLGGWGAWKFIPTFVFGLGCGCLFSRYGLYASIMLHFLVDMMSAGTWMTGSGVNSVSMLFLLVLLFGLYFSVYYGIQGFRWLRDTFKGGNQSI